jgi:hypothetical protein
MSERQPRIVSRPRPEVFACMLRRQLLEHAYRLFRLLLWMLVQLKGVFSQLVQKLLTVALELFPFCLI